MFTSRPNRQLFARSIAAAAGVAIFAFSTAAEARPSGGRKAGWSSKNDTFVKIKRERRGLFSRSKARSSSSTSRSSAVQRTPIGVARATRGPSEVLSHAPASTPKRGLLRRILGKRSGEAASQPATFRPLRRIDSRDGTASRSSGRTVRQLAPTRPNAVQSAPKINHALLASGSRSGRRVVINIARQRAYLYVDGRIAVDTPVSTARSGKYTPRGSFRVGERVAQGKISTIYNVSMPYWMRLGSSPYGMHAGYLPGYPASAGCIRMPHSAAQAIYKATGYSTQVKIVGG